MDHWTFTFHNIYIPTMTPGESIAKFIFTSLFRTYNIREGKELALICRDKNNRNNNKIVC